LTETNLDLAFFAKFIQEVHSSVLSFTHRRKYGQNAGRGLSSISLTVNEIEDIKKIKRIT
jgi:hypothetical protein